MSARSWATRCASACVLLSLTASCASTSYRNVAARAARLETEPPLAGVQAALCFDLARERAARKNAYYAARNVSAATFFVSAPTFFFSLAEEGSNEPKNWDALQLTAGSLAIASFVGGIAWWLAGAHEANEGDATAAAGLTLLANVDDEGDDAAMLTTKATARRAAFVKCIKGVE